MKLMLQRYSENGESTLGMLFVNGEFFCYTLEDENRAVKVQAETRIPAGLYWIGWQEEITPMTKRYREKYHWFDKHLHIKNVMGFKGVYVHVGNDDDDTAGCLLVGDGSYNNKLGEGRISHSTNAFKRLYKKIKPFVDENEIELEIKNEGEFLL